MAGKGHPLHTSILHISIAVLPFYTYFHCRTSILHALPLPYFHSTRTSIAVLPFYTHFHCRTSILHALPLPYFHSTELPFLLTASCFIAHARNTTMRQQGPVRWSLRLDVPISVTHFVDLCNSTDTWPLRSKQVPAPERVRRRWDSVGRKVRHTSAYMSYGLIYRNSMNGATVLLNVYSYGQVYESRWEKG